MYCFLFFCLAEQDIDEQAFLLLDEDSIKYLIPKIGPRLKFLRALVEMTYKFFEEPKGLNANLQYQGRWHLFVLNARG